METELLRARIDDTADICERTGRPKYLGFLSCEEAVLAQKTLEKRSVSFELSGGYNGAERVMLGCFPDWMDEAEFPIQAITFTYRKTDILRHRDFLGSLMSLGLKRESVGDILIEEGRAVVFTADEIADYVIAQTEKIGRVGVKAEKGYTFPLPQRDALAEFSETVASERLDCVVAALAGISRGTAAQKIAEGTVSVNSVVCEKATKTVAQGDVVAVRGKGKFVIDSLEDRTRKNRIVLKYKKYI